MKFDEYKKFQDDFQSAIGNFGQKAKEDAVFYMWKTLMDINEKLDRIIPKVDYKSLTKAQLIEHIDGDKKSLEKMTKEELLKLVK